MLTCSRYSLLMNSVSQLHMIEFFTSVQIKFVIKINRFQNGFHKHRFTQTTSVSIYKNYIYVQCMQCLMVNMICPNSTYLYHKFNSLRFETLKYLALTPQNIVYALTILFHLHGPRFGIKMNTKLWSCPQKGGETRFNMILLLL